MEIIIGIASIAIGFYIVSSILKAIYSSFTSIFGGRIEAPQGPNLNSSFFCSGCGQYKLFTSRSLKALRAGQKPVCKSCHEQWLAEEKQRKRSSSSLMGCLVWLGIIALVVFIIASM
ncbi:MAG: hypothetical protein AAGD09_18650 [Cyanobacteria bacterium P01_F01_bin.56]